MATFKVIPWSFCSHDLIIALICPFIMRVQLLIPLSSSFLFCIWLKCHLPYYFVVPRLIPHYFPWFWALWASSPCYSNLLLHCWLVMSALGSPGDKEQYGLMLVKRVTEYKICSRERLTSTIEKSTDIFQV